MSNCRLEYETLNEQVRSRSSNLWIIASIFIPVSWLVFTYCVINFDKIDVGGVSLLALTSLSSVLSLCFYTTHVYYLNSVSHYGLKELEKKLGICVHRFQKNFTENLVRTIARKTIYILSSILFLAWFFLGWASYNYWSTFKIEVALMYYLGTASLLPSSLWPYIAVLTEYLYNSWYGMDSLITLIYFLFIVVALPLTIILPFKEKVKELEERDACDGCTLNKNGYCSKYEFQLSRKYQRQINPRGCLRCLYLLIRGFFSCLRKWRVEVI